MPLSVRGWSGVLVVFVLVVIGLPRAWVAVESFDPELNWRQPTRVAEDYWQIHRWLRAAERKESIVILGDSVVWGEFAKPNETLAAHLSMINGENEFANLGVQGLYPVALLGLLKIEAPRSPPLLLFNPIWMTSARRDLSLLASERETVSVNHQALLPQWIGSPVSYRATLEERLSRWGLQQSQLRRWSNHLSYEHLDGQDLPTWLRAHPSRFPWQASDGIVLGPEDEPGQPIRRRLIPENSISYEWVEPDDSLQYQAFLKCVELLSQHGKPPCVLLASLSSSGRTPECLNSESQIAQRLRDDLEQRQIAVVNLKASSEVMADASHPTPDGYRAWAETIQHESAFQTWVSDRLESE